MNYCRTCKHWSVNANMIGVGNCLNNNALFKLPSNPGYLATAQNFGCDSHEEGKCTADLYPEAEAREKLQDFLLERFDITIAL